MKSEQILTATTDRELLELAAKAAGRIVGDESQGDPIGRKFCKTLGLWCVGPWEGWFNPLNNSGTALELVVHLDMDLWLGCGTSIAVNGTERGTIEFEERQENDKFKATRRAIVRAAASIGAAK
jgi:hypothetical protein